jgi:hypothetical protein
VDCDTCKKIYHITCLDPPLLVVPKKSKLYGWECSKCVREKNKSDLSECELLADDPNDNSLNKSNRLRRERKPNLFINDLDFALAAALKTKKRTSKKLKLRKKKPGRKPKSDQAKVSPSSSTGSSLSAAKKKRSYVKKSEKFLTKRTQKSSPSLILPNDEDDSHLDGSPNELAASNSTFSPADAIYIHDEESNSTKRELKRNENHAV